MSIQIANRFVWQDVDNHKTVVQAPDSEEVFRISYRPEASGNKLWVQINGVGGSGIGNVSAGKRNWIIYMAYSIDGGDTWNPPAWPEFNHSNGSFMANSVMSAWQNPNTICTEREESYLLSGELTVPEQAQEILLRVCYASAARNCPDAIIRSGSMVHIIEYEPKT